MGMFDNLDSREKENYVKAIGTSQTLLGDYANVTGDTFTGEIAGTALSMTGNATLATATIPTLKGASLAFTGTASIVAADIPTITGIVNASGTNIALTGTASIATANLATATGAAAATSPLTVQRTVPGSISIGALRISGNSTASQAVFEFYQKGFLSITSTVLTTVANTDYAIVVQVGLETRYIPLFKAAGIIGAATFA